MCVKRVFAVDEGVSVLVRESKDVFALVSRDDLVLVLRVEILQLVDRSACEFADLLEMKHLVDVECVHMCRHLYRLRLDAMLLIVMYGVKCSYEGWTVTTCLSWKE